MRFRIEQRFRGPVERVQAALVDPAYLERLASLPKLGAPSLVHREEEGDVVRMGVRYRFVGEVNAAVRRVVDPRKLSWVEESVVDRSTRRTTWHIVADHYGSMLRCAGTFELEPDGPHATVRVAAAEIKVNFPLVGHKVERAIVSGLEEHAELERLVMDEWLASPPGP